MILDNHHELCDGAECATWDCLAIPENNPVVQRVIDLWNANQGWIPGGPDSRRKLAEALGVPVERIRSAQEIKADRPFYVGEQLRWDGEPNGRELVSFRRMVDDETAEVMTSDGSRNAPIANLHRL